MLRQEHRNEHTMEGELIVSIVVTVFFPFPLAAALVDIGPWGTTLGVSEII